MPVQCKSCLQEDQKAFNGEIAIHFPGLEGLHKPIVWVFPKVVVCLNCGAAEFVVSEAELQSLRNHEASGASALTAVVKLQR